jgi:hypothetical protein
MSKTKDKYKKEESKQVVPFSSVLVVFGGFAAFFGFLIDAFDINLFFLLKKFPIKYSVVVILLLLLSAVVILIYYVRIKNKKSLKKIKILRYCILIMIGISLFLSLGFVLPTVNLAGKIKSVEIDKEEITKEADLLAEELFKQNPLNTKIRELELLSKDFDRGVYDKSEYKAEKEKILKRYDKVVELEYERQTEKE